MVKLQMKQIKDYTPEEIAELESQLPALEEEIDTLEDQLDELTKEKNSVEVKYSGLRSTVEEYKSMPLTAQILQLYILPQKPEQHR